MAMFCAAIVVSTAATNNDSGVFKGSDYPLLTKSLHDDTNQQQKHRTHQC